ncbi:hypothetical protein MJO55_00215 [Mycolicibacterium rufum]|uniref:Uncharacterized protein n=1 Tax=Mycolicibacterium rufum TaxID=318424 RepID=A0ABY3UJT3_9MYCO|nr:hypothetical protein [Mycolicibacterium rufum]ULP39852.1 hypothetical protein MJO55_00215 [Mycolicibacterium rufum]
MPHRGQPTPQGLELIEHLDQFGSRRQIRIAGDQVIDRGHHGGHRGPQIPRRHDSNIHSTTDKSSRSGRSIEESSEDVAQEQLWKNSGEQGLESAMAQW